MLDQHQWSRIGFGCYRVSAECPEHHDALRHALAMGCNVIDTSPNYMNGASERLVGSVLAEDQTDGVFVITKGGYLQGENWERVEPFAADPAVAAEITSLGGNKRYSIHPSVLEEQLRLSCERLGREQIGGYLLHNPEHLLGSDGNAISQDEFYRRIGAAFEFLEEQACRGTVGAYGVSSNTLPGCTEHLTTTNLVKLINLTRAISPDNHFRLVEFPYNLIEDDAARCHHGGRRMLDIAKEHGLRTFANRPLNAMGPDGPIRLATYETETHALDEDRDRLVWSECLTLIERQLTRRGLPDDLFDSDIIRLLNENWMRLPNDAAATDLFHREFFPYLTRLYDGQVAESDRASYTRLYGLAVAYSRCSMSSAALDLRSRLVQRGDLDPTDQRSLAVIACEKCLDVGIDHVLVGMRSRRYVDDLEALFDREPQGVTGG